MGSSRIRWLFLVVSAMGCSDKGGTESGSTLTTVAHTTGTSTTSSQQAVTGSSAAATTGSDGAATNTATTGGSGSASGSDAASSTADAGSPGGMAGMAGAEGSSDTAGAPAGAPTGGPTDLVEGDICSFLLSHRASTAIGTVQIVTWSTDLPNVSEAQIDFGLTGSELEMTAPVDLAEPHYRTLLLGMKGDRPYSFRIVVSSATETCTSQEISFMTGSVPEWVPTIIKDGPGGPQSSGTKGFIITSSGLSSPLDVADVYIFDTDGDVVWWTRNEAEAVHNISSARMSWDAKTMWYVSAYGNSVFNVSMDGTVQREFPELDGANHDLAVLPDGGIATMLVGGVGIPPNFVEMKADGSIVTLVPDLEALLQSDSVHPNAVHYHPRDDSFTLSDLSWNAIVKFTRSGELVWQFGGDAPVGDSFDLVGLASWSGNHGHHLTNDNHLLFFNNNLDIAGVLPATIIEVILDENAWTATNTWEFADGTSASEQLGDVQRLPSGSVLVTYSNMGRMMEVVVSGEVAQSFETDMVDGKLYSRFGYSTFRTSLYGPPPR